jgi:Zn-dependent M28 family amino/carboxypeptidase
MEKEKIKERIIETVRFLSVEIGQRSYLNRTKLNAAADYIEGRMFRCGCSVQRQSFAYHDNEYYNVIGELRGTQDARDEILVVGAHYDTVANTPGADDNASGVAGLLELAGLFAADPPPVTMRFVAFSLEEPPTFMTSRMGSHVYAEELHRRGEKILGMISLEMLGYYSGEGLQTYPASLFRLFYPSRGDFIAFVGNIASRRFTESVRDAFKAVSAFPVETLHGISIIPGVDFSDHRSFWQFGFPAFMVPDTAFYRNPNYHDPGDTAETLDYEKITELILGLHQALRRVASSASHP